jgi:hypothetical protein
MPVGHPLIITEGFKPIDRHHQEYKGLIKCLVLPPRGLFHPVLPRRSEGKLTFPLCSTCVDERYQGQCTHSDKDRQMWGCWTHVELYHAVDRGYQVLQIAEVYNWDNWSVYDGKDESTGLFTAYINAFLKIKQQVIFLCAVYDLFLFDILFLSSIRQAAGRNGQRRPTNEPTTSDSTRNTRALI